jgi:hypothetical protein
MSHGTKAWLRGLLLQHGFAKAKLRVMRSQTTHFWTLFLLKRAVGPAIHPSIRRVKQQRF